MTDPIAPAAGRRLGLLPSRKDPRALLHVAYLTDTAQPPPPNCDWAAKIRGPLGALGNDRVGDCTIAGLAHTVMAWTANAGSQAFFTDKQCVDVYSQLGGYDQRTGANDTGLVETDVLDYARKTGF